MPQPAAPCPEPTRTSVTRSYGYAGTPSCSILSSGNDQYIDIGSLSAVELFRWENENWATVQISSSFYTNNRRYAIPQMHIPCYPGEYSVYVECEGFQSTKHTDGKELGSMIGFIAYEPSRQSWYVASGEGNEITRYAKSVNDVLGASELKVNGCEFKTRRYVERDASMSFHLKVTKESTWSLVAPAIEKADGYNYLVSYGSRTWKSMEFGSVSITIVESPQSGHSPKLKPNMRYCELPNHEEESDSGPDESEVIVVEPTSPKHGGEQYIPPPSTSVVLPIPIMQELDPQRKTLALLPAAADSAMMGPAGIRDASTIAGERTPQYHHVENVGTSKFIPGHNAKQAEEGLSAGQRSAFRALLEYDPDKAYKYAEDKKKAAKSALSFKWGK